MIEFHIYSTFEIDQWKEAVSEKLPEGRALSSQINSITRAGFRAGISKKLGHMVALKYAESESEPFDPAKIAELVEYYYQHEQQLKQKAEDRKNGIVKKSQPKQ